MAPLDCQSASIWVCRELKEDMASRVLVVATATRDVDRLLIRSNDFETCWPRVNYENCARAEWGCERLIARDFRLCDPGEITGKQSRACNGTDRTHGACYGDFATKVPEAASCRSKSTKRQICNQTLKRISCRRTAQPGRLELVLGLSRRRCPCGGSGRLRFRVSVRCARSRGPYGRRDRGSTRHRLPGQPEQAMPRRGDPST